MAYDPASDFLALLRQTSGGVRTESMPGLDFVIAALARAGFCELWANPTIAPTSNIATTVWFKPSSQSWATEGTVLLYDINTGNFEPATPELWQALLSIGAGEVFQNVTGPAAAVEATTTLLAIQRDNPGVTTLALPPVANRTRPLKIVDWSTNVAAHQIIADGDGTEKIMRSLTFSFYSTVDQLAGVTLHPSTDLNGWVIAP